MSAYSVRITVQKKLFHEDMIQQYTDEPDKWQPCTVFEVGQEFIISADEPWEKPDGFCGWAWADMQKLIYGMSRGGRERFVTCCTDGYRPVVFLLERIEE